LSPNARWIAVTAGEPGGIGPDLCVMLARERPPLPIVVVADRDLLAARAHLLGEQVKLIDFDPATLGAPPPGVLAVVHVPLAVSAAAGRLDPANAAYVLRTLELAADGCLAGTFAAMATAPVHKGVINDAGIAFTGHTEFLAQHTHAAHVVMMLVGGGMRVALATTHLALREVPAAITQEGLTCTLTVLHEALVTRFGIANPRVLVAGLNPHAGESGHLGREEIEIIAPVVQELTLQGYALTGPLPADTLFQPRLLASTDAVLAMYHDQGLPVLKHASFGSGVNVTLGLPIIRTSVDHGTALDLAGTGRAESGSLMAAIRLAADLARTSALTEAALPDRELARQTDLARLPRDR
jgi:4-hydroxythreonine-4-phosphate dehydrogenase